MSVQEKTGLTELQVCDDPANEPAVGTSEHALWLAHWHFAYEESHQLEQLAELYTDDIIWEMHFPYETPRFVGKDAVLNNYRGLLAVMPDLGGPVIWRHASPEAVFIDQHIHYTTVIPDGVPKEGLLASDMLPEGRTMHGRLLHDFKIRDGKIAEEIAYFVPERITDPAS
ncbi:MAG: nuclear transport factor 2 family protein [Mycobacterium sp.]|nr:nuclear transport factor 2 family protein [Mycobacterium sp.]